MMRHQKMISLDGETLKIAEEIPNFSAWVRAQLMNLKDKQEPPKIWSYYCLDCDNEFLSPKKDSFFYCPNYSPLSEMCNNKNTLTPREMIQ